MSPLFEVGPYRLWIWSKVDKRWKEVKSFVDEYGAIDAAQDVIGSGRLAKVTFHGEKIYPRRGALGRALPPPRRGGKPRAKRGAKLPAGYKIVRRTGVYTGVRYDLTAPGGRWLGSHATRAAAVECAVRDVHAATSPRAVKGEIGWDLVSGDLVLERHLPKRMALSRVKAMRAFARGQKPDWDPDAKRARKPMIRNVGSGAARLIEAAERLKDAWKK